MNGPQVRETVWPDVADRLFPKENEGLRQLLREVLDEIDEFTTTENWKVVTDTTRKRILNALKEGGR